MTIEQVRFRDEGSEAYFGGILIDDGEQAPYVICGCCGHIVEMEDIAEIRHYANWLDISDEIIGNGFIGE